MSEEKVLTKEIAEQFLADEDSVGLSEFTAIEDEAAESLSKHQGILYLYGLTDLSDAAAEILSKHQGRLYLFGLTSLSDAAAESLSKHQGEYLSIGLESLSDAAAESLSKHQGNLELYGLTELSDEAAESLSKHRGELQLEGLLKIEDCVGHRALAQKFSKQEDVCLGSLRYIADGPAEILSKKVGGSLALQGLQCLSATAAEHLRKYDGDLDLDFDSVQGKKRFHVKHTRVVNEYTVYEIYAEDRESATNLIESWEFEDDNDEPLVISEETDFQASAVDAVWEPDED